MLINLITRQLVTLFLVLLFGIKLWTRKSFRDSETKYFWVPLISCLILSFEDVIEGAASQDPELRFLRIFVSVIGYTFRSVAAAGMLMVITPSDRRKTVFWIPCVVNLLVSCTAFFSPIAFGYDENYNFVRGPLGIVAFAVPALYLFLIVWNTLLYIAEKNGAERWIPPICGLFCTIAALADSKFGGNRVNEAILICCVFFYIFLYSHDNRRDPLTGLLNRQAFYDDCKMFAKNIGAVASLDMNGLKELNDGKGHLAGDEALTRIGECIMEAIDKDTQAYRTGGDEFLLLFFHDQEERIIKIGKQIKENVIRSGYHISVGYAMRAKDTELETAISESDQRMYADKARYYQESGKERRRR